MDTCQVLSFLQKVGIKWQPIKMIIHEVKGTMTKDVLPTPRRNGGDLRRANNSYFHPQIDRHGKINHNHKTDEYLKFLQTEAIDYEHIGIDTCTFIQIDIDDEKAYEFMSDKLIEKLKSTPYFLSAKKRLPHFILQKEEGLEFEKDAYRNKARGYDILCDTWSFCRKDEIIHNCANTIKTFTKADFAELVTDNAPRRGRPKKVIVDDASTFGSEHTLCDKDYVKTQKIPPERMIQAINSLDISHVDKYDDWIKIGAILKLYYGDDGFDIWQKVSERSIQFEPSDWTNGSAVASWRSFANEPRESDATVGTIAFWLKNENPQAFREYFHSYSLPKSNVDFAENLMKTFESEDDLKAYVEYCCLWSLSGDLFIRLRDGTRDPFPLGGKIKRYVFYIHTQKIEIKEDPKKKSTCEEAQPEKPEEKPEEKKEEEKKYKIRQTKQKKIFSDFIGECQVQQFHGFCFLPSNYKHGMIMRLPEWKKMPEHNEIHDKFAEYLQFAYGKDVGTLCGYLSEVLQCERKTDKALSLQSQQEQKAGKSFLLSIIRHLMGGISCNSSLHNVLEAHSVLVRDYRLIIMEEIDSVGEQKTADLARFKELVTGRKISVRPLYEKAQEVDNSCEFMICSNSQNALRLGKDSERVICFDVKCGFDFTCFPKKTDIPDDFHFLIACKNTIDKLADKNWRNAKNEYLEFVKEVNTSPIDDFKRKMLLPIDPDCKKEMQLSGDELYEKFCQQCTRDGIKNIMKKQSFLTSIGPDYRKKTKTGNVYFYNEVNPLA